MKKLFLTGISLLCAVALTFAQGNPEEAAKVEVTALTQTLSLTEDQSTAILEIIIDGNKAKEAIKGDATLSPEIVTETLSKQQATTDAQIADKLSEEQKPLFATYVTERPKEEVPAAQPGMQPVEPTQQPMEPAQPIEPEQQPIEPGQGQPAQPLNNPTN